MIKKITLIVSNDTTIKRLLNAVEYEIYEAKNDDTIFTMIERKQDTSGYTTTTIPNWDNTGGILSPTKSTGTTLNPDPMPVVKINSKK